MEKKCRAQFLVMANAADTYRATAFATRLMNDSEPPRSTLAATGAPMLRLPACRWLAGTDQYNIYNGNYDDYSRYYGSAKATVR
jgi:hypothetical protein